MDEIRVQPASFMTVNRTARDTSEGHAGRERERERERRRPPQAAPGDGPEARLAPGAVRVEPVLGPDGRVTAVRVYDARSGEFRGEITPEELQRFAERHQAYVGVLVERRL
ncbi:MAG TPA: hypothetical protein VIO14_09605 [Dehalococcoidia bacterium]